MSGGRNAFEIPTCQIALVRRLEAEAVAALLRRSTSPHLLAPVLDRAQLLSALDRHEAGLVITEPALLDHAVPHVERLVQAHPRLRLLLLTRTRSAHANAPWIRAGVHGLLGFDASAEELLDAVRRLLLGRRFLARVLAEPLVDHLGPGGLQSPRLESLSSRERQVFDLLARATPPHEIADCLAISVKTVSTYRARILEKLLLTNNAALMLFALHHQNQDSR